MPSPRLFLIDTYGFIFRAYHARAKSGAPPMRTSKGLSTEAVFIFAGLLRRLMNTYQPEYIAAIMESDTQLHREQAFTEYKANRAEMPSDLKEQIPYIKRFLDALRIPMLRFSGYEADDVIATVARRAAEQGTDVVIVSSDKDLLQLVTDHIQMLNPMKDDTFYDPAKVEEFMGVPPHQVADLLALKGDAVDNIPGAPGIGDKGARDLIKRFGSLDALLERAAEVERKTYRESLQNHAEQVRLSKRLATIDTAVPVAFSLETVKAQPADEAALRQLYKELEFHSLIREMGPAEDTRATDYQAFADADSLERWLGGIPRGVPVAVAILESEEGGFPLDTVGLAWRGGEGRAVPAALVDRLQPFLEDAGWPKIAADAKSVLLALGKLGIEARGFAHDILLYAFLLDADPGSCSLVEQAQRRLDLKLGPAPEQHADITRILWEQLNPAVDERGLRQLYE